MSESQGQLLKQALQYHEAGHLAEAAAGYQQILQQNPKHSDALHLLGVVAQQMDKLDMAIELMKAAIAQNPSVAHYHHNLGNTYLKNRQAVEAVNCYRQAILLKSEYFEAHFGMGNALAALNQFEIAAQAYQTAVKLQPRFAEGHYNLGRMLSKLDKPEDAITSYREAIQLDDEHAEFFFNLGNTLRGIKDYQGAIDAYRRSLLLQPSDAETLSNLGVVLESVGRLQEAEESYHLALMSKPEYPECLANLAKLLVEQKKFSEAIRYYQHAISLDPRNKSTYFHLGAAQLQIKDHSGAEQSFRAALILDPGFPEAYFNLGNLLRSRFRLPEAIECYQNAISADDQTYCFSALGNLALTLSEIGEIDAAVDAYRKALELEPDNAIVHCNLAYTLLSAGRLVEGWHEHEWRCKLTGPTKPRNFDRPLWTGEPLNGDSILLHSEQGFGDAIQFVRYVPMVVQRGGKVILDVPSSLHRLLRGFPGVEHLVIAGEPMPEFMWQCPLMSLPLAFETTLDTIPSAPAYLFISSDQVAAIKQRWPGNGMRVGLVWSGNPEHVLDAYRSMHLKDMMILGSVPGVSFYSLQVGGGTKQLAEVSRSFQIADVASAFTDFADTAAFVAGLDLVIAVDTAVAHLAGALGVPVWILIANCRSDWRWFRDRADSPWYPSARIFRQPRPGDWSGVVEMVKLELARFAADHAEKSKESLSR